MTPTIQGHQLELDCILLGRIWRVEGPVAGVYVTFPRALVQVSVDGENAQPHRGMLQVPTITCWEGSDVTVRALPTTELGAAIVRSAVDSITLNVFDLTAAAKGTPIHEEELEVADVMETSATLDAGWKLNTIGYTFKHTLPGNQNLFEGGRIYRCEYLIRTADSGTVPVVVPLHTKSILSPRSQL